MTLIPWRKSADLSKPSLEELFEKAGQYGTMVLFQHHTGKKEYSLHIKFQTIAGIQLEAKSDYFSTIHLAIEDAIAKAETIRKQFK